MTPEEASNVSCVNCSHGNDASAANCLSCVDKRDRITFSNFEPKEITVKMSFDEWKKTKIAQFCGNTGQADDVVGLPGIHIEVKRVEKLNITDAMGQAIHDSTGNIPIVAHRKNNCEWLITMRADDWFKLYGEWEVHKH